ncbi:MAG: DUF2225 domain-containing protein [Peptococcaceae bacterium]|jgi:uncharacterized protein (DUF2225 family)|nr:DUF2225 domain-containing protein [Peptococcaceae bacterium]MDH7525099.1 DUF2225 domain-containing protein [Peptococcaceae bacterium]
MDAAVYLYDKTLVCLNCDARFKTKKVRTSRVVITKKDADFCTYYEGENPYFYEVGVCPRCGCAFTENFILPTPDKKEVLRKEYVMKVQPVDLCGPRNIEDALRCYKLCLLCANFLHQPKSIIAGILLRIAWLYRYLGNKEEEERYLVRSVSLFEEVYSYEDPDKVPIEKHRLIYLIGELHGRLGRYLEARKWFNLLFSEKGLEPALNRLAREQWENYRSALTS